MWTWGYNDYGQDGDGSITWLSAWDVDPTPTPTAPARVGSGTHWVAVAAGDWDVIALQS